MAYKNLPSKWLMTWLPSSSINRKITLELNPCSPSLDFNPFSCLKTCSEANNGIFSGKLTEKTEPDRNQERKCPLVGQVLFSWGRKGVVQIRILKKEVHNAQGWRGRSGEPYALYCSVAWPSPALEQLKGRASATLKDIWQVIKVPYVMSDFGSS